MSSLQLYFITILSITLLGMLIGALLIFLGIRGRLFLGQSRCSKCNYQLASKTKPAVQSKLPPTGLSVCPECGATLNAPGAMRFDKRVRSKWKIASGIVIIFLSFAFPIAMEFARFLLRDNTSVAFLNGNSSTGGSALMRPMDETPEKTRHWQWELGDVSNNDLIKAITIRPEDDGLWDEIDRREQTEGLSTTQVREVLEIYADMQLKRITNSEEYQFTPYFNFEMKSIFERAIMSLDSAEKSNVTLLTNALMPRLIIDHIPAQPIIVAMNKSKSLILRKPMDFPGNVEFKFNGAEVKLNGNTIPNATKATNQQFLTQMEITLPGILYEESHIDHVVTITPNMTLTSPMMVGQDEPITWTLEPEMEFPLQVVPPGESATVYHELDSLPKSYRSTYETTKVAAWTLPDSNETMLAISFSYPSTKKPGAINMHVIPNLPNNRDINNDNHLIYAFGDGWMSGSSRTTKTYRLPPGFDQDTIDVVLEPNLVVIPEEYAKSYGLLGSSIVIEDLPVRWIDREKQSTSAQNLKATARIERIGSGEEAENTSIGGPLFGPSLTTSSGDTEVANLLGQWLQPTILTWTNTKGKRWAQFQYGCNDTLPINSQLHISIENPGKRPFTNTIKLTHNSTKDIGDDIPQRGAYWFNPVDEELLPGTIATIELRGFPSCLRRDKRDNEEWFGGTFTLEIPVIEGTYDKDSRRLFPLSVAEDES